MNQKSATHDHRYCQNLEFQLELSKPRRNDPTVALIRTSPRSATTFCWKLWLQGCYNEDTQWLVPEKQVFKRKALSYRHVEKTFSKKLLSEGKLTLWGCIMRAHLKADQQGNHRSFREGKRVLLYPCRPNTCQTVDTWVRESKKPRCWSYHLLSKRNGMLIQSSEKKIY